LFSLISYSSDDDVDDDDDYYYYYYIIHAFTTRAHSVMVLNQSRWQSLGRQHGKGVDGLFEKVSFQTAFEGVESG